MMETKKSTGGRVRPPKRSTEKMDVLVRGLSKPAVELLDTRAEQVGWSRNELMVYILEAYADGDIRQRSVDWQVVRSVEFLNLADRIEGVEDVLVEVARRLDERLPVTRKRDREEG
ncbi:hypothetical protein EXIGUO8H_180002 [Exiguobacterium sp. 8H]|nr:hypothetical protein EXIGUO8H_180002 [Exiguobacterium sp. 8H]VXB98922.1 hypothetical protein EXIGUO8A_510005 [Exiguobacterium sp. 8A]